MIARDHRQYGLTLVELLIAVTITALLSGVFFLLIFTATRLWYRTSAHAQSYPDAAIILAHVTQDLKCAGNNTITVSNTYAQSTKTRTSYTDSDGNSLYDTLTFDLPSESDRVLNPDPSHYHDIKKINDFPTTGTSLTPGTEITYYPKLRATHSNGDGRKCDANNNGIKDSTETWNYELHRKVKDMKAGTVLEDRIVADNADLPTFYADGATNGRVYAVYAAVITLVGQQGATMVRSSYASTVDIRNSALAGNAL